MILQEKQSFLFCTSASSSLGESGELLEEMADSGDWKEGHRFSSSASDSDIKSWTDTFKINFQNSKRAMATHSSFCMLK